MSKIDNGALPAFPSGESWKSVDNFGNALEQSKAPLFIGLTKREQIASQIMAGLCANNEAFERISSNVLADIAVNLADALIARLGKVES